MGKEISNNESHSLMITNYGSNINSLQKPGVYRFNNSDFLHVKLKTNATKFPKKHL